MSTVPLAGDVQLPMVGFGTWRLRGREAYDTARYALEVGYRHLDTATMYDNEAEIGRAVRDSGVPRHEVFITTKLQPFDAGRERQLIDASLHLLGTDYVDLWLIHAPPAQQVGVSTWREFIAIREAGLARAIGVSNYSLDELDVLIRETGQPPAVNQIPWSPSRYDPDRLAGHRQRGIVLEGYSPLLRTRLDHPVLAGIAQRHQVAPAQVVLRWHLEHGIPVIPKSGHRERIASNFDLFGFSLTGDEVSQLDQLR